ncbi:MAG: hypothetical protein U9R77_13300, partial [Pseudomonadota bacterium]|nr:hypothetical protein [Pseudomonadota bacterium]
MKLESLLFEYKNANKDQRNKLKKKLLTKKAMIGLVRLYKKNKGEIPTIRKYKKWIKENNIPVSLYYILNAVGSWNNLMKKAFGKARREGITKEEIGKAARKFKEERGRLPTMAVWKREHIHPCYSTIVIVFGSWNNMLEEVFGEVNKLTALPRYNCLVCGKRTKNEKFCSLKCRDLYHDAELYYSLIYKRVKKRGFVTNQTFYDLLDKYVLLNAEKRKSHSFKFLRKYKNVKALYRTKKGRIGFITKEF